MGIKCEYVHYEDQLAYLALPEYCPSGLPAVVVIHDLTGLNNYCEDVTRRIAAAGYAALAPDLFAVGGGRPVPLSQDRIDDALTFLSGLPPSARSDPQAREAEIAKLNEPNRTHIVETTRHLFAFAAPSGLDRSLHALKSAVRYLRCERPETLGQKVACMGEELSLRLASEEPDLSGAVVFYASPPAAAKVTEIRCPLMAFYGANDPRAGQTAAGFAEAMRLAGKSFEYHVYEGAGRGFFCDTKANYFDVRASRDAFARLLMFLLKTLA